MDVLNDDPQIQPVSIPVKPSVTPVEDLDRNVQIIHQILSISNIDFKTKSIYVSICVIIL